jgi:hypothetical protein
MAMDNKTVYIETSIVSYLTARPTRDLLVAAWQKATLDWWDTRRDRFDLYTSEITLEEAGRGNPQAASRRLDALSGIPILAITQDTVALSKALLQGQALPAKALDDALHISVAAVHGIDHLLTWNFRHLDNAETKPIIRSICAIHGYASPEICTPQELMGVFDDV